MGIIIRWLVSALAIIITAYLLPGVTVSDIQTALIAALVLGIINAIIKPLTIILTLPINIITLGLFTFVINALMILLTSYFVPGFHVVV
jgi:putative membrane protein